MRLSFFRTGTGHRVGKRPLATPFIPQISFTREVPFRRLIRSLSLRPYSLLASRADRTGAAQRPPCPPRLLRPGFQIAGSPRASAGYDYGAKLRIAPAGLPPASTAASLAAPCPGTSGLRQAESGVLRPHRLHYRAAFGIITACRSDCRGGMRCRRSARVRLWQRRTGRRAVGWRRASCRSKTIRKLDETCLTPVRDMIPEDIRAVHLREHGNRAVIAGHLNVMADLVSQ